MAIIINGTGSISGLSAGGLPDASVTQSDLASGVAGTGPAFSAYPTSGAIFSNSTWTKVTLNAEQFDTNSNFDSTTNYRFTPTVAGYYQVNAAVKSNWNGTQFSTYIVAIFKNGSTYSRTVYDQATSVSLYPTILNSTIVYLNGTTDYLELYVYASGGSSPSYEQLAERTYLTGVLVRAA